MLFDNSNLKVNMNGTEYLEYRKYKDKPIFSKKFKKASPYFAFVLIGMLVIWGLVYDLTYVPPEPVVWGYSNLFGVTVHNGLIEWLSVAIG